MNKNLFDLINSKTKEKLPSEVSENFLKRIPIKKKNESIMSLKIAIPSLFSIIFIFIIYSNNQNNIQINDSQIVQNIELLEEFESLSFLEENDLTIEEMELLLEEEIDENLNS
jgi:hypothetical protein